MNATYAMTALSLCVRTEDKINGLLHILSSIHAASGTANTTESGTASTSILAPTNENCGFPFFFFLGNCSFEMEVY